MRRRPGAQGEGQEIASGNEEEVEIRALTVRRGVILENEEAFEDSAGSKHKLDWFLWREENRREVSNPPQGTHCVLQRETETETQRIGQPPSDHNL